MAKSRGAWHPSEESPVPNPARVWPWQQFPLPVWVPPTARLPGGSPCYRLCVQGLTRSAPQWTHAAMLG
eukprot:1787950-Prorocentrum_lima.AAC.1